MKSIFSKYSGYLLIIFLLILWELVANTNRSPFLPSFTSTIKALYNSLINGGFLYNIFLSIYHALMGLVISFLIMVPLGIYIGRNKFAYNLLSPLIEFLRPLPSSAIIPIAIIYLGIASEMKVFVIVFGSCWPILLNTINGVKSIEPMYLKTGKVLGFSKIEMFKNIILPASLPSIFTGLRISISIALILTITVEMIVGSKGIGYFIIDNERSFAFPQMFGGILALGIIGLLINKLFNYFEMKMIKWHYEYRK
jgi:ABC-type nitrate/sulfonate/bicarbonate transport system permease component